MSTGFSRKYCILERNRFALNSIGPCKVRAGSVVACPVVRQSLRAHRTALFSRNSRKIAMDLTTLEREAEALAAEDQDHLSTFLAVLRARRNPAHAQELADLVDDRDPAHWLCLDEVKRRLAAD
ncbi:MAG: hypothetical protein ACI8W8_000575 [Rhodothermales bacterium]|jgi:hypothetical protein